MSDGLSGLVNRIIAWADRLQREHGVLGFPYAVIKKYGDDAGGRQAALITYYGFLSIFPLLLLGVAVLSRVLASHPDLRERLISLFVPGADGRRPCFGWVERFQDDPAWKDNLLFNEYFHGDNGAGLGASHQTGWTGLVAELIFRARGAPVPTLGQLMSQAPAEAGA